jgi:hypothetical protein
MPARVPSCRARCLLALAALLAGCEPAGPATPSHEAAVNHPESVEARLHGTWLREEQAREIQARRILVLEAGGAFRESVRITDPAGAVTERLHAGRWFFDGTNLKRKYTLMNGEPPSRLNLPFVTFEIRFETRNAFIGIDHIHGNRIAYRRVQADTQP